MKESGFTLIELIVVCAIIVVVSAVVLANQNKFGGQALLQNFAYDVALSIRQAQVYGIAVARRADTAVFNSYGVHFDLSNPTSYTIFSDASPANGVQDSGEAIQTMNITRGYKITNICVADNNGQQQCTNNDGNVSTLDIEFQRPEPDAYISWAQGGASHNCITGNTCASQAVITLSSPRGDTMSVTVSDNGQIAVTTP